jgi:hypothetical protein
MWQFAAAVGDLQVGRGDFVPKDYAPRRPDARIPDERGAARPMATLRSYSNTIEQASVADVTIARWRFAERSGTVAVDAGGDLDGRYQLGFEFGRAGVVGDGAGGLDDVDGRMVVDADLRGEVSVAAYGDSLVTNRGIPDPDERYVPSLEAALDARGLDASVLPFGAAGDTTCSGQQL